MLSYASDTRARNLRTFLISFYIYVLTSNIGTIWRQHKIVETWLKTCASWLPVCHQFNAASFLWNYLPNTIRSAPNYVI